MSLQTTDTIVGTRPGFDPSLILGRMEGPDTKDAAFAVALAGWCTVAGIDPAIPFAQWLLETDDGKSIRWNRDLNASGMGIVADGTVQPFTITDVDISARLFVQCLYALVYRKRHPDIQLPPEVNRWFDQVWLKKVRSPAMPDVRTVGDLGLRYTENGDSRATWSWEDGKVPQDTYGKKLVNRLAQFYPNLPAPKPYDPPVIPPTTGEEPIMPVPQTIDFSSLPFPVRVVFIPITQSSQRPGLPMVPESTTYHDTGNPSVNARCQSHVNWMADGCRDAQGNITQTSWHMTVDDKEAVQHLPFNEIAWHAGDGYNGPGNRTSIAIEECVNSDRDVAKTRRNAQLLHAHLRKELGLSETKPHKAWSGKNCPENLRNAGLWDETAKAIDSLVTTTPKPPANPVYAAAHPVAAGSRIINTHQFLAPGGKTFQFDTIPAEWADGVNVPTGPTIKKGTKITQAQISHYVQGTDGNLYLVLTGIDGVADGSRVPASAVIA